VLGVSCIGCVLDRWEGWEVFLSKGGFGGRGSVVLFGTWGE